MAAVHARARGARALAGRHSTVSPHRPGGAGARAWTAGMAACITTGCEALDSALGNGMGAVRACRVQCAMCAPAAPAEEGLRPGIAAGAVVFIT